MQTSLFASISDVFSSTASSARTNSHQLPNRSQYTRDKQQLLRQLLRISPPPPCLRQQTDTHTQLFFSKTFTVSLGLATTPIYIQPISRPISPRNMHHSQNESRQSLRASSPSPIAAVKLTCTITSFSAHLDPSSHTGPFTTHIFHNFLLKYPNFPHRFPNFFASDC